MTKEELLEQALEKPGLANFGRALLKDIIDTAFEDGKRSGKMEARLEARLEGKLEFMFEAAKTLKDKCFATDLIMKVTGLSQADIDKL